VNLSDIEKLCRASIVAPVFVKTEDERALRINHELFASGIGNISSYAPEINYYMAVINDHRADEARKIIIAEGGKVQGLSRENYGPLYIGFYLWSEE